MTAVEYSTRKVWRTIEVIGSVGIVVLGFALMLFGSSVKPGSSLANELGTYTGVAHADTPASCAAAPTGNTDNCGGGAGDCGDSGDSGDSF